MHHNTPQDNSFSLKFLAVFLLSVALLICTAIFTFVFSVYITPDAALMLKASLLFFVISAFMGIVAVLLIRHFAAKPAEEKKTQQAIASFQTILNSIDSLIYVSDPDTDEVLFINDKMRQAFNLKEGEGVGSVCWKTFQKDFTERCAFCPNTKLKEHPDQTLVWEEENTVTAKHYRNTDTLIPWPDGRMVHLQNSMDITNLKTEEDALKQRLAQQKFIIDVSRNFLTKEETSQQISTALKLTGEFLKVGNVNLYKCDRETHTMRHLAKWLGPEATKVLEKDTTFSFKEGDVMYDAFVTACSTGIFMEDTSVDPVKYKHEIEDLSLKAFMVFPLIIADEVWGTLALDSTSVRRWTDGDKYIGRLVAGMLSGVMARQEVEKTLVKMSRIAGRTSQYVASFDKNGMFSYYNPATLAITGYSAQELEKGGASILYDNATSDKWDSDFIPNILKYGDYEFEAPLITKTGEKKIMSFVAFTIGEGDDMEMGSIATDITKAKQMEEELRKAKETAEQASSAKGDFLSRMSHEIRTPINAVMGMSSIAKASKDIEKKDYCLEKIDTASTHLLGIINDILDVSKIEANKLELSNEEFDIEKMLFDVTNVVNFRIDEKKQNFVLRIDRSVPQTIISDEMRLKQVVLNLLTNASKFTPENGSIELNVRKIADEDNKITLQVSVKDSGIGLTPEQSAKLFRSFEQADGSISRKFGGTGLGLVISKRIVELMDGNIEVRSEYAKGSEFIFTIKAGKGKSHAVAKLNEDINIDNLRILAVDDAEEIREYFTNIMELFSIKCDVAASGAEALELIEKNKSTPYNIIFVDWMMPGMDGIELTKKIKDLEDENKPVVIMISMSAWSEIEEQAKKAGVAGFVPKPLFPSALINAINERLSGIVKDSHKKAADTAQQAPDLTGVRLLIAEDVDINREIIEALLEETHVKIDFAVNGVEAVEMFTDAPAKYDAIIMDIQMPEMDGFTATRIIRSLSVPEAGTIPIIAMTANVFVEDIEKCIAAGMNDHLGKPINIEAMFEKLNKYLVEKKTV
ncbi:PAS domain S-box-containing protein [Elusimicrobium simillimum]|uniref:response regulator n=1 Tax=Elusimicrobium simillimum TaxID=3143438 RepID=UPI003C6EF908